MLVSSAVFAKSEYDGINLKTINEFIKENPHDPNLYFVKGQILLDQGKLKKAQESFETVLSIYPTYYEANFQLAQTFLKKGDYEQALESIDIFLEVNEENVDALNLKTRIFLLLGDFNSSLSISDGILEKDAYNGKAHLFRGEANFELGNFDAARSDWEKAKSLGEVEAGLHIKYLFKPVW